MLEFLDEFIEICGLSLIEMALGQVTKRVQFPSSPPKPLTDKAQQQGSKKHIPVVFNEAGLLVVNKPADLVINSNDKDRESVQTLLRHQFPRLANDQLAHEFYFIHRLDFSTSGILCIALNKKKCTEISQLFERRLVDKYYLAIVRGHIDLAEITIDIPVGEDIRYKTSNKKMCTSHDWEHCLTPRPCETKLVVLEKGFFDTEFATKVLLKPVTGRRHQLRVHCSQIGHPIVGDFTYSSHLADCSTDANARLEAPPRMMLHAYRIKIQTASSDAPLDLATEDPFKELTGIRWHTKEVILTDLAEAFEKIDFA